MFLENSELENCDTYRGVFILFFNPTVCSNWPYIHGIYRTGTISKFLVQGTGLSLTDLLLCGNFRLWNLWISPNKLGGRKRNILKKNFETDRAKSSAKRPSLDFISSHLFQMSWNADAFSLWICWYKSLKAQ